MNLKPGSNGRYLLIAIAGMAVQLPIFKWLYPYPDFFTDTYYYISTAASHANYDIWPLGYSKFLDYGSFFTHNPVLLVIFQYILIQSATFYLFITIRALYNPNAEATKYLFWFLLFDPLALYVGNYITTDALFWGLSEIWIALLLRSIQKPNQILLIIIQGILLATIFPIRYTAFYYPIILVAGILLSKNKLLLKVIGIGLPSCLIILFILFMRQATYQATGVREFNSFSGWQLANNALYMYAYLPSKDQPPMQTELKEIAGAIQRYFDTSTSQQTKIGPRDGAFYIWSYRSPLGIYAQNYISSKKWNLERDFLKAWGQLAPLYGAYGKQLILAHPSPFINHYILPNAGAYFYPPLESLSIYDGGTEHIFANAKAWFYYDSQRVYSFNDSFQLLLFSPFPILFLVGNLCFLLAVVIYWGISGKFKIKPLSDGLRFIGFFLLINMGFSILAAPVVLRYQIVPFNLCWVFSILVYDHLILKNGLWQQWEKYFVWVKTP